MATKEELFAAVRLISNNCARHGGDCSDCPLLDWCDRNDDFGLSTIPEEWRDPEEGGGGEGG